MGTGQRISSTTLPSDSSSTIAGRSKTEDDVAHLAKSLKIQTINQPLPYNIDKPLIENHIGFATIPVGLAGPLQVTRHDTNPNGTPFPPRYVYAPLALHEGTVVAASCRGSKALNMDGGMHFSVLSDVMMRAPVFIFADPGAATSFRDAWPAIEPTFREWAESTSRFAKLAASKVDIIASTAHITCSFRCGDAAGQNMVTKACEAACRKLMASQWAKDYNIRKFYIDGNMSSDKKASWSNVMQGRGVEVMAWGKLTEETCRSVLKCSLADMHGMATLITRSARRGGHNGDNANVANVISAMFLATGQDMASVVDGSWAQLTADYDVQKGELSLCLYFPGLLVGTVGGGVKSPTAVDALRVLGCDGPGKKGELAGLMACFAMTIEISTMAAIVTGTFTESHMILGRKNSEDSGKNGRGGGSRL